MGIKIVQRSGNISDKGNSPVAYGTSKVRIRVMNKEVIENNTDSENLPFESFEIFNTEPLTVSVSTSWKDGAGAVFAGKLNELFNSKLLRAMSGENIYTSPVTDAWSQRVVDGGSPLSLKLKFRVYYGDTTSTCSVDYFDLIKFLTKVSSTPIKYTLKNATLEPIISSAKKTRDTLKDIKEKSKTDEGKTDLLKMIEETAKKVFREDTEMMKKQRGNYTFLISTPKWKMDRMDWILKSWSMSPSVQFKFENGTPNPLWIDFDLNLETNVIPSNYQISKFFNNDN